ncbi:hypothetical protein [Streptomyces sp. NPDC001450]
MLILAGCGSSATTERHRSPGSTTAPTRPAEKTADVVLSDLRFASVGVGEARVSAARSKRAASDGIPPCLVAGVILTSKVPGEAALLRFTSRLHQRGWKLDGAVDADFTALKSGEWDAFLGAAPVPAKFKDQAGTNKGGISVSVSGRCKRR